MLKIKIEISAEQGRKLTPGLNVADTASLWMVKQGSTISTLIEDLEKHLEDAKYRVQIIKENVVVEGNKRLANGDCYSVEFVEKERSSTTGLNVEEEYSDPELPLGHSDTSSGEKVEIYIKVRSLLSSHPIPSEIRKKLNDNNRLKLEIPVPCTYKKLFSILKAACNGHLVYIREGKSSYTEEQIENKKLSLVDINSKFSVHVQSVKELHVKFLDNSINYLLDSAKETLNFNKYLLIEYLPNMTVKNLVDECNKLLNDTPSCEIDSIEINGVSIPITPQNMTKLISGYGGNFLAVQDIKVNVKEKVKKSEEEASSSYSRYAMGLLAVAAIGGAFLYFKPFSAKISYETSNLLAIAGMATAGYYLNKNKSIPEPPCP